MKFTSLILFVLFFTAVYGQKKEIDHTVYNDWKKNENQQVSTNGNYISYEINPHRGDGHLYIYSISTAKLDSFPRGKEAKFSFESDYLTFKITPGFDTLRNCELNKVDKKKWPKDSLGIYIISKDSLIKIPLLKSFTTGEENNWLSYIIDENEIRKEVIVHNKKKKSAKKKDEELMDSNETFSLEHYYADQISSENDALTKKKKKEETPECKSDGKVLTVVNPIIGKEYKFKNVTDHQISKKGEYLAMVEHQKIKVDSFKLVLVELKDCSIKPLKPKYTSIKSLSFNDNNSYLAFHSSSDTSKVKMYSLNLYSISTRENNIIADSTSSTIPVDKSVSENRKPLFSEDGRFLFFGVADRPVQEKKDSLLESEKVKLDLWHYQDKRLQPQQLVELKRDQKKSDLFLYNLSDKTILQLSNDTLKMQADDKIIGDYLFASSDEQYSLENQWEVPNLEDHYRVSVLDGSVELIKRRVGFNGEMSPAGNYYTYFDGDKSHYYLIDFTKRKEICITCSVEKVNWQTDINGMPMTAYPHGTIGYSLGETTLYIQSQYDIWSYDLVHNSLTCLTGEEGVQRKIRMSPKKWSYDSVYVDYDNLIIEGFNEKTKGTHLFNLIDHGDHTDLKEIYYTDHSLSFLTRSKNKETIVFRKMSLLEYPEVSFTQNLFEKELKISSTNPQQSEYNWATVELVNWKSYDGIPLEGLLYKPENFDPLKKYPLMIYYYELYSDEFHNHYIPKPTASIIYPTEYASAGYIVFIPDIRYKPGYPAKSAYNCIMSGTDHVLKLVPNIDSTKMGLQGQSWGGYQTAQLITMTNRYKAAMAGAPVSDMISAYGGIRWGSGVNRQFQYERTQSRIGKTIWSAPELYIENSPVFHIPNIQTPLMIMANDKDGAVPWYQGIEMFTCMKRLGKPCWMLNYNGDDHNLMENANRFDLSIRMRQFFDHYLLDQPAPKWLTEGIPATVKGKELRYE